MRPLDGITVVTLEHAIAAPFCTRQLADLGARVIKVERPGSGDFARAYDERVRGLASHFIWTNRGKESVTLDVKNRKAQGVLTGLLAKAGVLVQNLAPGAAARIGLSYEALKDKHPGLIVCDISGYGDDPKHPGPYREKKAYDLLIQSESGFLSITDSEGEPAKAACSIADIAAGMYAYTNILAAVIQRGKTGKGCRIDVSMLESMVEWMGYPLYYAFDGATPPPRAGAAHATIFPYGPFPAGDGKTVMLGLQNEREWLVFCRKVLVCCPADNCDMKPPKRTPCCVARPRVGTATHRPHALPDARLDNFICQHYLRDSTLGQSELAADERFASNSRRVANQQALRAIIVEAFAEMTAEQVAAKLDEAQIANAQMNDMRDVWQRAQLKARERWTEIGTPTGPIPALLPPGQGGDAPSPRMGDVPTLGQHTDAILAELGFDDNKIADLHQAGAV